MATCGDNGRDSLLLRSKKLSPADDVVVLLDLKITLITSLLHHVLDYTTNMVSR